MKEAWNYETSITYLLIILHGFAFVFTFKFLLWGYTTYLHVFTDNDTVMKKTKAVLYEKPNFNHFCSFVSMRLLKFNNLPCYHIILPL